MAYPRNPVFPPVDGSLTFIEALDFNWQHNAELPIYAFNRDGEPDVTEISFLEFGRACHRVARLLPPYQVGKQKEVVAFIALVDTVVYHAVLVGAIKAGLVPFPISPRNTAAAIIHLLKKTACHRILATKNTLQLLLDDVKFQLANSDPNFKIVIEEIPSLTELYPKLGTETKDDPFEPYPMKTIRPEMSDVVLYLHSSGSSGFPKAIPQTYGIVSCWPAFPYTTQMRDYKPRIRVGSMHLPPFHMLGLISQLISPLFDVNSNGVYPPMVTSKEIIPMMPTPDNVLDHMRRTNSNSILTVPALLQVWGQSKEAIDFLKTLEAVQYSGGALSPKLGHSMVASGVKLAILYGGTEFGPSTYVFPRDGHESEWPYAEFSERTNVRWVPQGDGTFECQFLVVDTHLLPVENLPDVRGYATSDLWERHPTKPYLWKIVGRIDDVIVHSSGEKTVPGPMEDIIMGSIYVAGTVIFGRSHDQPGVLIEPKGPYAIDVEDHTQLATFRNQIWPDIEEANKVAPAFSKIFKEMILVTSRNKPLSRTGKGTVMKKMALKVYDPEIEALYETVESSAKGEDVIPPPSWTEENIQEWLLQQAIYIYPTVMFSFSTDLFEQGFDSLGATILRRRLSGALRTANTPSTNKAASLITQNTVYNHSSIETLAAFVTQIVADTEGCTDSKDHEALIEDMISKYSTGLDGILATNATRTDDTRHVILLTGSTGNLGSQILAVLLGNKDVERIYTLSRVSPNSRPVAKRHQERFENHALDTSLLTSERLVFLEGDASQYNLGLSEATYKKLQNSVTIIIHAAWKLDFNLSLASFEPHVKGTRNLINFARAGPFPASTRFLFTSSTASAQSWNRRNEAFPEEVVTDASVAVGTGYGESKYVSERILSLSGLQAISLRIGQLSGGLPNGAWATTGWLPILVKSSVMLGAFPSNTGVVSWLPMHSASNAILDIVFSPEQPPIALNLVHPKPVEWDFIITLIRDTIAQEHSLGSKPLRIVPFEEWFSLLEDRAKPAIKLLEFFRAMANTSHVVATAGQVDVESGGLPKLATEKVQKISATARELCKIGTQDAQLWVKYWNNVGLFIY